VNIHKYGDEFDAIPLPEQAEAETHRLDCSSTNMQYIRSNIAIPQVPLNDFIQRMAKHQWQAPFVRRDAVPAHMRAGMLAIGARRDLGTNPMMEDHSRPKLPGGPARDWDLIPGLERVSAYVFRGGKRVPSQIKAAGSFPPAQCAH
jgi:hypothetical protein